MSEYKSIDCVGWWESPEGIRLKVIGFDSDNVAWLERISTGKTAAFIDTTETLSGSEFFCKHLPDCTGWDWQPEPEIKERKPKQKGGWIQWSGGNCPVARSEMVEITMRNGRVNTRPAGDFNWEHFERYDDIMSYRVLHKRQEGDWIKWDGGECPVNPDQLVEVFMSDGGTIKAKAGDITWAPGLERRDVVAYRVLHKKQDDGWIKWDGGECPVDPETIVEVRFRCGETDEDGEASYWRWYHGKGDYDIVAYREVKR